jgi:hypothetical protein
MVLSCLQTLVKSQADGERVYLETLNTSGSVRYILTMELLSTHADTEVYMGDPNHSYILVSPFCPLVVRMHAHACHQQHDRALQKVAALRVVP